MKTLAPQGIEPNGGGALSSDYVRKEVSKKLRNFSFAPEKACHCEDERSEDVAIAKSLNINEITTQSPIARNDKLRHPELADCELRAELDGKRKIAFTLAEVLITLGIIGVVVALTLPSVIERHQKLETVTKLKKAYSTLSQAIERAKVDNGDIQNWGLGDLNGTQLGNQKQIVIDFSEKYLIPYLKNVKSASYVTPKKFGYDKISNLDGTVPLWLDMVTPRYILALNDGTVVGVYVDTINKGTSENPQDVIWAITFFVDLNGTKGPNVIGHDIFAFLLRTQDDTKFTPYVYSNTNYYRALYNCKSGDIESRFCTALIMMDGWQIKDHYPWRFKKLSQ